jgi:hypothetical protein
MFRHSLSISPGPAPAGAAARWGNAHVTVQHSVFVQTKFTQSISQPVNLNYVNRKCCAKPEAESNRSEQIRRAVGWCHERCQCAVALCFSGGQLEDDVRARRW